MWCWEGRGAAGDSVGGGGSVKVAGSSERGARGAGDEGYGGGGGGDGGGVGDVWAEGGTQETKVAPEDLGLSGPSPPPAGDRGLRSSVWPRSR